MKFESPPILYKDDKTIRHAGFEFEFAGLELHQTASIIQKLYGGDRQIINRFKEKITNTELGDFKVEFDSRILKEKSYEKFLKDKIGLDLQKLPIRNNIEDAVASISSNLVPVEVVAPPIPFDKLEQIEKFRDALYHNKAEGTSASLLYALAFHINAEVPNLETQTVLTYLKAFLLLQYWIFKELDINFTRQRLTGYINFFPHQYLNIVLNPDYNPDLDTLIKDYKLYNPTRNRPLDFYPLFVALKGRDILGGMHSDADLVRGRPTFHYRLPDSHVDDPDWRIANAWNSWVIVERLAADHEKMEDMIVAFQQVYKKGLIGLKRSWIKKVKECIDE